MALQVTLGKSSIRPESRKAYINWDNEGIEIDYENPADIIAWAQSRIPQDTSMVVAMFLLSLAARDPSLSKLGLYEGDTIVLDPSKDFFAPGAQLQVLTNG